MPDSRSFYGLWPYIRIAIPSALMTCTDWWVFELMIFTSGLFGVYTQAAQIVMMNISMFFYFIAQGFAFASTQLIGSHLGKGDLIGAKQYLRVIQFNCTLIFLGVVYLIYYVKNEFVSGLTSIPEVHKIAMSISHLLMLNSFPEQFKGINKGFIRGLNLQGHAVWIHLTGNWALNACLQYYFLIVNDYGLFGIWYSKIIMESFIAVC